MKWLNRITRGDMHGVHYAVSVLIATALLWFTIPRMSNNNPVWAISSMVATADPLLRQAAVMFRWRVLNAFVGCAIGLVAIAIGGAHLMVLPVAMAVTVFVSWYVIRVQTMWRQAPIGCAFVIGAGLEHHMRVNGLYAGAVRMGEVMLGCVVGIAVAWVVSKVWPLPDRSPEETVSDKQEA
jgi:uncharacterized membrane protein YccC